MAEQPQFDTKSSRERELQSGQVVSRKSEWLYIVGTFAVLLVLLTVMNLWGGVTHIKTGQDTVATKPRDDIRAWLKQMKVPAARPKQQASGPDRYRRCAEAGNAVCQRSLAYYYSVGEGVPHNDSEAFYWLTLAAEQGDASAQDDLGVSYGDGRGVDQDWVQSYVWIARAARQGEPRAKADLEYATARMTPEQLQQAKDMLARD